MAKQGAKGAFINGKKLATNLVTYLFNTDRRP